MGGRILIDRSVFTILRGCGEEICLIELESGASCVLLFHSREAAERYCRHANASGGVLCQTYRVRSRRRLQELLRRVAPITDHLAWNVDYGATGFPMRSLREFQRSL